MRGMRSPQSSRSWSRLTSSRQRLGPLALEMPRRGAYPLLTVENMERLLIQRGRVIDPASGLDETADVLLEGGKVKAVGMLSLPGTRTIDARGLLVAPGLIDLHVHLREPGDETEETIASGSAAAVAGGLTSVVCMANTRPPVDHEAAAEYVLLQAARAGLANIYPVGAVTKGREGRELAEIGQLARAGAVAFSDDGDPVRSAEIMRRALEYASMFGKPIITHAEDHDLSAGGVMNEGAVSMALGLPGAPAASEEIAVARDIHLAELAGGHLHVAHVSTAGSVALLREAKARGVHVTAEATPHHLTLTEDAAATFDTNYKMNPPLRTRADVEALVKAVLDGTVDAIATDHAPHSAEEKELEFPLAPNGVIGMESMLAVVATELVHRRGMSWIDLLARLTAAPARIVGIPKGTLARGADADVVLIDPDHAWTIDRDAFRSRSRNCPFHGWKATGRAVMTIVGGEVKWQLPEAAWQRSRAILPRARGRGRRTTTG